MKLTKTEMGKSHIILYIITAMFIVGVCSCTGSRTDKRLDSTDSITTSEALPNSKTILSHLRQNADLVTTEVTIRKIIRYDSSKHEHIELTNPNTWKYGDRKCIVPIEVKIEYGYDMRDMSVDNIKLTDDSTAIVIELPKAKVINAGYDMTIERESVTSISTGLRDVIGHEFEEELRKKGYESVLKEDLGYTIGQDVERNAKSVFVSIVRSLGFKNMEVVVVTRKE